VAADITSVNTVASNATDVQNVSANIADVGVVADNLGDVTNFADVYIGASSNAPSTRKDGSALQAGDLYFNTSADALYVYSGSAWQVATASADQVSYDNASSGLTAADVQAAIDELESLKAQLSGGNSFTGNQQITGNLTVEGTLDCGTLA